MNVKTLATVAILVAIGVGLYVKINNMPEPVPPPDFSGTFGTPAAVELGDDFSSGAVGMVPPAGVAGGGNAPTYVPPAGDTAPAFDPSSTAPAFNGGAAGQAPAFEAGGQAPAFGGGNAPPAGQSVPGHDHGAAHQHNPGNSGPGNLGAPVDVTMPGADGPAGAAPGVAPESFSEVWDRAQRMLQRGELGDAHLLLSDWYFDDSLNAQQQADLTRLLSQLAGTVIYSKQFHMEAPVTVQTDGQMLDEIAKQYKVPTSLLAKINGVSADRPLPRGTELKVVRGPFSAIVDAQRKQMVLMVDGRYAGRFPIGIGQEQTNVQGQYVVKNKMPNPTYYGRDRVISADDPGNPLGEHWIGLAKPLDNAIAGPFGIHGSSDPDAVTRNDPRGYIRLAPQDAQDAFDILSVGSTVIIRR